MNKRYTFNDFVEIIRKLRSPEGCPWDRAQTHKSLTPCMINETAEAIAAVDVWEKTGNSQNLCEELGDMLLQVVLQSQIAEEEGLFDISDVVQAACEKMVRRHPHVFAGARLEDVDWEKIKQEEKQQIAPEVKQAEKEALARAQDGIIAYLKEKRR
ncbi:MAG: MazG nucleotide pyrophosphohydrolase domain-containing protein [Eubacteriales bacterium]|nr:MazG nucleotide pyrophosphohydrolase domain-containing protein [Eubacteriales bacterium]